MLPESSQQPEPESSITINNVTNTTINTAEFPFGADESSFEGVRAADVICAQNRRAHKHVGNQRYQEIVQQHREAYFQARRKDDKSGVTRSVIQKVKENGARFMKYDKKTETWVEIDANAQHEKVSHALRNVNSDRKRKCPRPPGKVTSSLTSSNTSKKSTTTTTSRSPSSSLTSTPSSSFQTSDSSFRRILWQKQSLYEKALGSGDEGILASPLSSRKTTNQQTMSILPQEDDEPKTEPALGTLGKRVNRSASNKDLFSPLDPLRSANGEILQDFAAKWGTHRSSESMSSTKRWPEPKVRYTQSLQSSTISKKLQNHHHLCGMGDHWVEPMNLLRSSLSEGLMMTDFVQTWTYTSASSTDAVAPLDERPPPRKTGQQPPTFTKSHSSTMMEDLERSFSGLSARDGREATSSRKQGGVSISNANRYSCPSIPFNKLDPAKAHRNESNATAIMEELERSLSGLSGMNADTTLRRAVKQDGGGVHSIAEQAKTSSFSCPEISLKTEPTAVRNESTDVEDLGRSLSGLSALGGGPSVEFLSHQTKVQGQDVQGPVEMGEYPSVNSLEVRDFMQSWMSKGSSSTGTRPSDDENGNSSPQLPVLGEETVHASQENTEDQPKEQDNEEPTSKPLDIFKSFGSSKQTAFLSSWGVQMSDDKHRGQSKSESSSRIPCGGP